MTQNYKYYLWSNFYLLCNRIQMTTPNVNLTACIIDDDLQSIELIQNLLKSYFPEISVSCSYNNSLIALQELKKTMYDLYFIDVNMPNLTGFQLLENLDSKISSKTIITTGYSENSIQAIRHQVFDFLEKPIQISEFIEVIQRFKMNLNKTDNYQNSNQVKFLIQRHDKCILVDVEEIIYFEANGAYTNVFMTGNRKLPVSKPIGKFTPNLPPNFINAGRSYFINVNQLKEISKSNRKGIIVMKDGSKIEVSLLIRLRFIKSVENIIGKSK